MLVPQGFIIKAARKCGSSHDCDDFIEMVSEKKNFRHSKKAHSVTEEPQWELQLAEVVPRQMLAGRACYLKLEVITAVTLKCTRMSTSA